MATKAPHDIRKITGKSMLDLRKRLNMTQSEFWSETGVTQSAGSRYETGRDIPAPTRIAVAHTYSEEIKRHKRQIFA